jgi:hypothetical protein
VFYYTHCEGAAALTADQRRRTCVINSPGFLQLHPDFLNVSDPVYRSDFPNWVGSFRPATFLLHARGIPDISAGTGFVGTAPSEVQGRISSDTCTGRCINLESNITSNQRQRLPTAAHPTVFPGRLRRSTAETVENIFRFFNDSGSNRGM